MDYERRWLFNTGQVVIKINILDRTIRAQQLPCAGQSN